jgi:hypothetical protein
MTPVLEAIGGGAGDHGVGGCYHVPRTEPLCGTVDLGDGLVTDATHGVEVIGAVLDGEQPLRLWRSYIRGVGCLAIQWNS